MSEDTTKSAPEPQLRRAWGLAAASLVCALAGVFLLRYSPLLLPIMTVPAIVSGHWARHQIRKNPRRYAGSGVAFAGLILGYLQFLLILSVVFFGNTGHRFPKTARRINCAANLKGIGLTCKMYASDYGGAFPPDWKILWDMKYLDAPKIYICPSTKSKPATDSAQLADPKHCDYVYFGAGQIALDRGGAKNVLAADRTGNHKGYWNVVFGDGHVEGVFAAPGTDFATVVGQKGWLLPGAAKKP